MSDLLHGGTALLIYFAIAASTALVSRALITIPDELFRKILHFIGFLHVRPGYFHLLGLAG